MGGKIDLPGIVLIGLSEELPEHDEKYELHRLLGVLLSKNLSSDGKLRMIETEYDIPIEAIIGRVVSVICNLSQGIREKGRSEREENTELTYEEVHDLRTKI